MEYILLYLMLAFAILISLVIVGETIVQRLPDSHRFSKWWKRNIIDKDPYF